MNIAVVVTAGLNLGRTSYPLGRFIIENYL